MSYSEASNDEIIEKNSEQNQLEGFKILEEFKKVYQDRFLELEEKSSVTSEHQRNNVKIFFFQDLLYFFNLKTILY